VKALTGIGIELWVGILSESKWRGTGTHNLIA